jgi:hypothetical protein
MIPRYDLRKRVWLLACVGCVVSLLVSPGRVFAQDAEEEVAADDVKLVVRVSKQLIADVMDRVQIYAAIPYKATVLGFSCEGVINGQGKLSVDLDTHERQPTFVISGKGTARTWVRGVHWPIVATGPAWGPFTSRTLVRFDGRKFSLVDTVPWATVHGELQTVEGVHERPVGRAVGSAFVPLGEHLVPQAEREARPIAEYYLKTFVDGLAGEVIPVLNRPAPVEDLLKRAFPETRDGIFHLSADSRFIQVAYGPRGSAVPALPRNTGRPRNARVEVWLRSSTREAQTLARLSRGPLARQVLRRYVEATIEQFDAEWLRSRPSLDHPLIQKYLEVALPQLTALTREPSVDAIGSWVVISFGGEGQASP